MSLFGSIQMGSNTLQAMQIGLQVVGDNIANANTPGYVRQEAVFEPSGAQKKGSLILGLGVTVDSIIQKIDKFTQARLVGAKGDRANADVQQQVYRDLETVLNELSNTGDLSSSLSGFFESIENVLGSQDAATRNLVMGKGQALADDINSLYQRAQGIKDQLGNRISASADEINGLTEQIRKLNVQIAASEVGGNSQAGGLRVQRQFNVDRLSEIIGINVAEQTSGGLSISVGGDILVYEGERQEVELNKAGANDSNSGFIQFKKSQGKLNTKTGELLGLYAGRDTIVGGFVDRLDSLAGTLAFEFNKVYSQGQGLVGFQDLTSQAAVDDPNAPLDAAGLPFTPESGAFNLLVHNKETNLTESTTIQVRLHGMDNDTTLNDLASQIDAIGGISASVTVHGQLRIKADSSDVDFSFAAADANRAAAGDNGTGGVLAALGLNTFFTGSTAATLGVNDQLKGITNAGKFAASLGGVGVDSRNAELLSVFMNQPIQSADGSSLTDLQNQLVSEVTQGSSVAQSVADGFRTFESSLEGQRQAVSGVSIDEEAVNMLTLQRIYQASAKYIATISDLLDQLVKL